MCSRTILWCRHAITLYHSPSPGVSPLDTFCSVLFCSLAVLDPRVGHTMDVLSPFISSILCHSRHDMLTDVILKPAGNSRRLERLDGVYDTIRYDTIQHLPLACRDPIDMPQQRSGCISTWTAVLKITRCCMIWLLVNGLFLLLLPTIGE